MGNERKRLQTSLNSEVERMLNQQVQLEDQSSQYYLSFASWCEREGYVKAAEFLYEHAEEERQHMLKFFKYINAVGGHALAAEITAVPHEFDSLRQVFELVLEHEVKVTKAINEIVDCCFQSKDFSTFQFLQWFVAEQREEEETARTILDAFDLIGEDSPQGLWLIDQEIGRIGAEGVDSDMGDINQ
ncbi:MULTISPECIES: ferritin [Flammeovirga]|uniref:Ferritin n=1 Tax=Flammeovirga agarivorans TaxID=2726742 RepID=A0A7X8SIV3_9BACT|nr:MULTISPECIES: ferritin [Flammeovirga]NLR91046.1 ferritin [Flammeovirga agarivorans]